jgi:hypothetical protein
MTTEVIVALWAATAAVGSALLTIWSQMRVTKFMATHEIKKSETDKQHEVARAMERFQEPLIRAAYDLQSRLYNISVQNFLRRYYVQGTVSERSYVVRNTQFLFAQYFAWNEIIRRQVQFVNLGEQQRTRRLSELQDTITNLCTSDEYGRKFGIFAGEQRAIGERMIREAPYGLECMGYADFVDTIEKQPGRIPYLDSVEADIIELATAASTRHPRLLDLQGSLIALLEFLDPDFMRFPRERRSSLSAKHGTQKLATAPVALPGSGILNMDPPEASRPDAVQ